jgi:hypothetical protein
VNLKKHKGYLGGLDSTGSSGTTAPYYATATMEVIFHEIVRMPTKKSEIENDKVPVSKVTAAFSFFMLFSFILSLSYLS